MKKTILLSILLFQMSFVFGQTDFGNWTPSPCYKYIQFQMKFNGKSSVQSGNQRVEQGWYTIRIRNTSTKRVAFSYIISINTNREVFRHSSSNNTISKVKIEGGAPDTRLDPNEIIEKDVYLTKTFQKIVYFDVWALAFESNDGATINEKYEDCNNGNLCLECQEHPNQMSCESNSSTSKSTNQQNTKQNSKNTTSNSLSIEQLENIIISNLKRNLKTGSFDEEPANYGTTNIQKIDAIRDPSIYYGGEGEPNTLYIYHYLPGESRFFGDKFVNLKVEKKYYGGQNLLYFVNNDKSKTRGLFLYNFGNNDENFVELKNAIESIKKKN